jgi:hypothetical protein
VFIYLCVYGAAVTTHVSAIDTPRNSLLLIPKMLQLIQQTLAMIVPSTKVLTPRAEIHTPNILQRGLARRPIRKHRGSGDMEQLEPVLLSSRRHGQDLPVVIEL